MKPRMAGTTIVRSALQRFRELPWTVRFAITCTTGIVVLLVLCWILSGFSSFGFDPAAAFAFVLGITFMIGIGVGLMTLIFYSNRSGQDDAVRDAAVKEQDPAVGSKS